MPIDVSVVMPCWNAEARLERALDEVFSALPDAGEVLAVDDGSTDATREILIARAAREPRLRVIVREHLGVSAARNSALELARGEWLFFVDPDDGVEPEFFTAALEALRRDGADCCVTAYRERTAAGELGVERPLKGDYRYSTNAQIVASYLPRIFGYSLDDVREWNRGEDLFARREPAQVWRMAWRRELVERRGIRFDEDVEYGEDAMFNAACLLEAGSMTCVPRALYRFTVRPDGATGSVLGDGRRRCRNKLALLAARNRLDERAGGRLGRLYEGSCVLAALEIFALVVAGRLPRREGLRLLKTFLADSRVASAFPRFPLSWRHPLVALAHLSVGLLAKFWYNTRK